MKKLVAETLGLGQDSNNAIDLTYTEHLEVLRNSIFKALAAIVVGIGISYFYADGIIAFLTAPATKLYYMKPAEAFFVYVKVIILSGLVIASPVILYEFWSFVLPAFTQRTRQIVYGIVAASMVLFFIGTIFSYLFILPIGLKFFLGFDSMQVQSLLSMESYVDFVFMIVLPFGLIFEIPLVLVLLAQLDVLSSKKLYAWRKYVFFGAFVLAGIVTPPDVVSQILMALPMLLLYELSALFIKLVLQK